MEEEWIRIKVLEKVDNLVAKRNIIDNAIELWEERLNAYNIKHKFDVEYNGVVSIKLLNGKTVLYSTTYNPSGYTYSHYEIKGDKR